MDLSTGTMWGKVKPSLHKTIRVPFLSVVALTEEGTSTGGQVTWPGGFEWWCCCHIYQK